MVNESQGSYMACVTKDKDTIRPLTVQVVDINDGRAQRTVGEWSQSSYGRKGSDELNCIE